MDTVLPEPAAPSNPIARVLRFVRRSIPKSLVLAVIGIGLSSWLIPAVTRQWDDRQKAGELKAALVTEMATATGRAVLDAQTFTSESLGTRDSPSASAAADASVREWSVAALEIRARLDAYFGSEAVEAWDVVTNYVNATLSFAYRRNDQDAVIPLRRFEPMPPGHLQELYSDFYDGEETVIRDLALELLTQEERVAREILTMDVRGYSTTWDDILSDLLPSV